MRTIPNMTVLCPCDREETFACVKAALEKDGPVYLRFGRVGTPDIYEKGELEFEIGKGQVVRDGMDAAIIVVGDMVFRGLEAAKILEGEGIRTAVIDMASIKPIDSDLVCRYAQKTRCIVTAEDHNVIGGLGGAVAEVLARECPTPMEFVGVQDQFGRSGTSGELEKFYGLTAETIVEAVKRVGTKKIF